MYTVRSAKREHKRYMNHLRPRYTEDVIAWKEVLMDTLYDIFDIIAPSDTEIVVSRRNSKIKHVEPLIPDPKRKKNILIFLGK